MKRDLTHPHNAGSDPLLWELRVSLARYELRVYYDKHDVGTARYCAV